MPRNKKYAKAPENMGKSTITSNIITKEIKLASDPSKIAQFYSDNKKYLDEAEKYYLYDQYQNAKHIEYLKQSKQYVQSKEHTLKVEGDTVELTDITLNRKQDTALGCWSCAYELLLQSKGIKLDQKNIRSYRPNVSSDISDLDVKGLLDDNVFSIPEMADLAMDVLPNTTVRSKKLSANLSDLGEGAEYTKNIDTLAKELSESLRDIIKNQKTPVAITDNYHYITVVGVDDNGYLLCKDSLGVYNDPNHTYTYDPLSIVERGIQTAQNNHTGVMSIQMTHLEDLKLEGNKIKNFEGTPLEKRVEYNDGKAVVDTSIYEVEDTTEKTETNINGIMFGHSDPKGFYTITESAYIPENLTVIQPEPTNEFEDINAIDDVEAAVFNDIFDVQKDAQKEEPLEPGKAKNGKILEGKYEYVHFGTMSKDEQKDFASRITDAITEKMVLYATANNSNPAFARINENVINKLETINTEIANSIESGGRISDKAITAIRDVLGAVSLVQTIMSRGPAADKKMLSDINSLSDNDLDGLIHRLGGIKEVQDLMTGTINNKREIINVISRPAEYVTKIMQGVGYDVHRAWVSKLVSDKPWNEKEPVQAEKQQPAQNAQSKTGKIVEGKYEYIHFGSMNQAEKDTFVKDLASVTNIRVEKYIEASNKYPGYAKVNEIAINNLLNIGTEVAESIKNGGRLSDGAIKAMRNFLGAVQIGYIIMKEEEAGNKELLDNVNLMSANNLNELINEAGKSDTVTNFMAGVINDTAKFNDVIDRPLQYVDALVAGLNQDNVKKWVDLAIPKKPEEKKVVANAAAPKPAQKTVVNTKPEPAKQAAKKKELPLAFKVSVNLKRSIKELENAKTFVNSSQYKDLISYMKDFDKKPGDLPSKLSDLGNKIDQYLYHKAEDGIKPNVFKKLAAVQRTNDWLSNALYESCNVVRPSSYEHARAYSSIDRKIAPELLGDDKLEEIVKDLKGVEKVNAKKMFAAVDNCLCVMCLKAGAKDRAKILEARDEFSNHPRKDDLKNAPTDAPTI